MRQLNVSTQIFHNINIFSSFFVSLCYGVDRCGCVLQKTLSKSITRTLKDAGLELRHNQCFFVGVHSCMCMHAHMQMWHLRTRLHVRHAVSVFFHSVADILARPILGWKHVRVCVWESAKCFGSLQTLKVIQTLEKVTWPGYVHNHSLCSCIHTKGLESASRFDSWPGHTKDCKHCPPAWHSVFRVEPGFPSSKSVLLCHLSPNHERTDGFFVWFLEVLLFIGFLLVRQ